jgi:hypothetical protein
VAALVVLVVADRGLGRLDAGALRAHGATSAYASASVFSLDVRELGRALAARSQRTPRRPRRFRRVSRAWHAVAAADLLLLARSPRQAGEFVLAAAVPVLAARTDGIGRLPLVVWAGLLAAWATAAMAAGHPARHAQAQPALDRHLPLSRARLLAARCVAPALVLCPVFMLGGLLVGAGSGSALPWALLALATVPPWVAASLRGAYRPELDWSGPVMSTPMGALPVGVGATLFHGIDIGLLGSLPVGVMLLRGESPSWALITGQLGWGLALTLGALTLLARRRG